VPRATSRSAPTKMLSSSSATTPAQDRDAAASALRSSTQRKCQERHRGNGSPPRTSRSPTRVLRQKTAAFSWTSSTAPRSPIGQPPKQSATSPRRPAAQKRLATGNRRSGTCRIGAEGDASDTAEGGPSTSSTGSWRKTEASRAASLNGLPMKLYRERSKLVKT